MSGPFVVVTAWSRPAFVRLGERPLFAAPVQRPAPDPQHSAGAGRDPVTGRGAGGSSRTPADAVSDGRRAADPFAPPPLAHLPGGRIAF